MKPLCPPSQGSFPNTGPPEGDAHQRLWHHARPGARTMKIFLVAAATVIAALASAGSALAVASFATPGKAVYCGLSEGEGPLHLICWRPADGLTFSVGRSARAQKWLNGRNRGFRQVVGRVLRYGETWSAARAFRCVSRATGLTCMNRSHHGWWIGRRRSGLFR